MPAEPFAAPQWLLPYVWFFCVPVTLRIMRPLPLAWRFPLGVVTAWVMLIMLSDYAGSGSGPMSAVLVGWFWAIPYVIVIEGILFVDWRHVARRQWRGALLSAAIIAAGALLLGC